jgi:hypothetical protein
MRHPGRNNSLSHGFLTRSYIAWGKPEAVRGEISRLLNAIK